MHYMTCIILAGLLTLAHSVSADVVTAVETLNGACQDALAQADCPTAKKICQAAVAKAEQGTQNTPIHAIALNNLAGFYLIQGHYAPAEFLHKRALAMREHALGPEIPKPTPLGKPSLPFTPRGDKGERLCIAIATYLFSPSSQP